LYGHSKLTDECVTPLARLCNLQSLDLAYCEGIRGHGFAKFAASGALRELNLESTGLDGIGAAEIARITSLELLDLASCNSLQDNGLIALFGLTDLRSLCVQGCLHLSAAAFVGLGRLTQLQSFNATYTKFGTEAAVQLAALTQLENLRLSDTAIDSSALSHISRTVTLRSLDLAECPRVGDRGLGHLAALTNLEYLRLEKTGITGKGLRHLAKMTKLRSLDLQCTNVDGAGLEALQHLKIDWIYTKDCPGVEPRSAAGDRIVEDAHDYANEDPSDNSNPPKPPPPADPAEPEEVT
jgi:hypothetical protein